MNFRAVALTVAAGAVTSIAVREIGIEIADYSDPTAPLGLMGRQFATFAAAIDGAVAAGAAVGAAVGSLLAARLGARGWAVSALAVAGPVVVWLWETVWPLVEFAGLSPVGSSVPPPFGLPSPGQLALARAIAVLIGAGLGSLAARPHARPMAVSFVAFSLGLVGVVVIASHGSPAELAPSDVVIAAHIGSVNRTLALWAAVAALGAGALGGLAGSRLAHALAGGVVGVIATAVVVTLAAAIVPPDAVGIQPPVWVTAVVAGAAGGGSVWWWVSRRRTVLD